MKIIAPLLLVFFTCFCTHAQKAQIKSNWHPISRAKELSCQSWPLREKEFKVEKISPLRSPKPGFFATTMRRDGSVGHYFSPLSGLSFPDPKSFVSMVLPRRAILLGGIYGGRDNNAIIATNGSDGTALELRAPESNVVVQRFSLLLQNVVDGSVHAGSDGSWILLQDGTGKHHLYYLTRTEKSLWDLQPIPFVFNENPKIAIGKGELVAVWRGESGARSFQILRIAEKSSARRQVGMPLELPVGPSEDLESWFLGATPSGIYLAMVFGDSLLGDAKLKLGIIENNNNNNTLRWIGDSDLRDVHVTEPFVMQTALGTEVMLMNWVDEESSIARYIVGAGSLSKPLFSGIFTRGTHIIASLEDLEDRRLWVLTRHRIEARWVYHLCVL